MRRLLVLFMSVLMVGQGALAAVAAPAATQHSDARSFADGATVGAASLTRNDNGVATRITVDDADPGVYTLWWVVWNTPEDCGTPWACVEADLFNPDAGLAIGYGGGALVGPRGRLQLSAHLSQGATLDGFPYPEFGALGVQLTETSLLDARQAEIHLVLRSHGPKVPGQVDEMLHTFNGACIYEGPIAGAEPAYGAAGPNSCQDRYFSVFPAPAP
jgi:hypothetical protein